MTSSGTEASMHDVLKRISVTLEIPVSAFYDQLTSKEDTVSTLAEQAQIIVRLFVLIPTQERRNQVLELVQKLVP